MSLKVATNVTKLFAKPPRSSLVTFFSNLAPSTHHISFCAMAEDEEEFSSISSDKDDEEDRPDSVAKGFFSLLLHEILASEILA